MRSNIFPPLIYINVQVKGNELNGTFSPVGIITTLYLQFIHRHYNILPFYGENIELPTPVNTRNRETGKYDYPCVFRYYRNYELVEKV